MLQAPATMRGLPQAQEKEEEGNCYGQRLFLPNFQIASRRKTANLAVAGVLENTPGHCPEDARNATALA
jgi:hypothetical protein